MRVREFEKLKRTDLTKRADEAFQRADEKGPSYLLEAQFYMQELDRRHDSWISIRDFILEIVVIALIGWEIVIGRGAEKSQNQNFAVQKQVLENLEKSSQATADTLIALKGTTETMSGAMQKQLALFYEVSLTVVWDNPTKHLIYMNNGHTDVMVWGEKMEGLPLHMLESGRRIPPQAVYNMFGDDFYNLIVRDTHPGTFAYIPYDIYVQNERGEKFIQRCLFRVAWPNNMLDIGMQVISVEPAHWKTPVPK